MTNRTVLGPLPGGGIGLRVSRPGFNVLDGGLTGQQVAFDSRWLDAAVVYMQGSVVVPVGSAGSYYPVSFGTTFSVQPPVIAFRDNSGALVPLTSADGTGNNGWYPSGSFVDSIRIYNDRMEFPMSGLGTSLIRYIVMRPLG